VTGIGLRVVSRSQVYFCVIEKDAALGALTWRTNDLLNVPLALDAPEQFSFVRNTLMDIFEMYNVTRAALRIPEFDAHSRIKQTSIDRYYLEGVIQESIAGSKIEKHIAGRIGTLARFLPFPATDFKKFANNEQTFSGVPSSVSWDVLKLEERESVLACHASLGL
jgi:hypothetical protein